jgi:tripartite-type tricarboxylate transporter receptor subunit TctC
MDLMFTRKLGCLLLICGLLIAGLVGQPAHAAFLERIIKIIVPQAPGGGTDAIARVLAQEMAKDLGGSVIVENKAGAGAPLSARRPW